MDSASHRRECSLHSQAIEQGDGGERSEGGRIDVQLGEPEGRQRRRARDEELAGQDGDLQVIGAPGGFEVDGDDVIVGGARVVASIPTSNGIINVVDKVILP